MPYTLLPFRGDEALDLTPSRGNLLSEAKIHAQDLMETRQATHVIVLTERGQAIFCFPVAGSLSSWEVRHRIATGRAGALTSVRARQRDAH